jgi:hypothetical protein
MKGRPTISDYSYKIIPARDQTIDFDCECKIKCSKIFSDQQKQKIFNCYSSLKSYDQQYVFLKSLIIQSFWLKIFLLIIKFKSLNNLLKLNLRKMR